MAIANCFLVQLGYYITCPCEENPGLGEAELPGNPYPYAVSKNPVNWLLLPPHKNILSTSRTGPSSPKSCLTGVKSWGPWWWHKGSRGQWRIALLSPISLSGCWIPKDNPYLLPTCGTNKRAMLGECERCACNIFPLVIGKNDLLLSTTHTEDCNTSNQTCTHSILKPSITISLW